MKTNGSRLTVRPSAAAFRGGLAAIALAACAGGAVAQTAQSSAPKPTGTIDVGLGDVSQGSYKAGEYNGLDKAGAFVVGNIDLRSGTSYNSASALRWRITGTDLGLESRSVSAQIGVQGVFRVTFGYDTLRRDRSDSYQTPYDGAGTSVLTLPGTWLVSTVAGSSGSSTAVNTVSARGLVKAIGDAPYISTATNSATMGGLLTPTAGQRALVDGAAAADVAAFHNVDLSTTRTRYDAAFSAIFAKRWGLDIAVSPEHKEGLKPMGALSRTTGGDVSTIIPDRIDTEHNQVTMNLNFKGTRSFVQAGYYGSFFQNNVPFMSWQNWATPAGTLNTISSTPSNQFNGTAGYTLSPTTKVVATGSYARSTQNDAFLADASTVVVPVTSLNGLVVSTALSAKLTSRPTKKLSLVAWYKYDSRDNRTPIHIFQYSDAGEAPAVSALFPAGASNPYGTLLAQNANANRPYSRTLDQFNADAEYSVAKGQWIKGGYGYEKTDRTCPGSWIDCADAATTSEQTLRAEWRGVVGETLTARVGYAYSVRRSPDYNENAFLALVPYANVGPVGATAGMTALSYMNSNGWTGWGPALGYAATTGNMNLFFPGNNALANADYANNNRISELVGMRRYYVADRHRDKFRASLNWQASDRLSIQAGWNVNRDDYPTSVYGLQDATGWALSLDGSYALGDHLSASVFYTHQTLRSITAGNSYTANSNAASVTNGQPGAVGLSGNGCDGFTTLQQRNDNNKLDPCLNWSANMLDSANSVGFGLKERAGALDVTADFVMSRASWDNNVTGGNWANNILNGPGGAPTTAAAWFIAATALPTVTTNAAELRVSGTYALSASRSVRVGYAYIRMDSADWAYEGMQFGSLSGVLPTGEQPFNYGVNVVAVSYLWRF